MISGARTTRVTRLLASWRGIIALTILAELVFLREVSEGHFLLLLRGGEAVLPLWYLHTFTKVTLLGAAALLFAAMVERRAGGPALLSRQARWPILALHAVSLIGLVSLITTLPRGFNDRLLEEVTLWRYAATSGVFLTWQTSALALVAPRALQSDVRWRAAVFALCGIATALILSSEKNLAMDLVRGLIEDSTLSLALSFYALIGNAEPLLGFRDGTPLLSAGNFAILISPVCAGYQGLLSAGVVMTGLIALEWPLLRSGRALVLGVLAVAGVFTLNALRIALLFHIGVAHSRELALDGFHSYFGTLSLLAVVALAMLAMQHRFFRRKLVPETGTPATAIPVAANEREAGLKILPLAIYLGIGMVVGLFTAGFNWWYPLTALAGLGLLALWRRRIAAEFADGTCLSGFAMGFAVYVLWLALVPTDGRVDAEIASALTSAPPSLAAGWIMLRLFGFSIVVPVLEELAFRGGVQRLLGEWLTPLAGRDVGAAGALAVSSVAFGAMHADLLAGTLAGLGFGVLVLRTGRVGDAIVAHAVTNFLLAMTAMATGHWSLW